MSSLTIDRHAHTSVRHGTRFSLLRLPESVRLSTEFIFTIKRTNEMPGRNDTRASDPIPIELSMDFYMRFKKELGIWGGLVSDFRYPKFVMEDHMRKGDSRAAVVVAARTDVMVAAYTDEMDCVAMLRFPKWVNELYPVEIGTRLTTVNTYTWLKDGRADDLIPGPSSSGQFGNFFPIIAEFIAANPWVAEARKKDIDESEWQRTTELAAEYRKKNGTRWRDGNPFKSKTPAKW